MNHSLQLTWWIILMVFSAFFSGMEIAFISSDKLRYALDKKEKGFLHYILNIFYGDPRNFLSTLAVGNLLVLIIFVYFTITLSYEHIEQSITSNPLLIYPIQIVLAAIILLFTGEFFPRIIFSTNANLWVKVFALPAFIAYILLYPITKLCLKTARFFLRIVGVKSKKIEEKALGRFELDTYVKEGLEKMPDEGLVDSEVKIFRNALDFSSMKLRDCMVPRADIVAISIDTNIETLKNKFIETGLSKILVFKENIDNILGYIHMWEMFNNPADWTKCMAPISVVPESMQANKLMSDLMQAHRSIAVVVDEFGGTSGIVTMEDLVEEIFGEIEDEYDVKSRVAKQESKNEYVLSGRLEIDQINEMFELDLPESDEYSTLAGLLLHYTQRFPKTYETIKIPSFTFKVLKVTDRKIEVVRLFVNREETAQSAR